LVKKKAKQNKNKKVFFVVIEFCFKFS